MPFYNGKIIAEIIRPTDVQIAVDAIYKFGVHAVPLSLKKLLKAPKKHLKSSRV